MECPEPVHDRRCSLSRSGLNTIASSMLGRRHHDHLGVNFRRGNDHKRIASRRAKGIRTFGTWTACRARRKSTTRALFVLPGPRRDRQRDPANDRHASSIQPIERTRHDRCRPFGWNSSSKPGLRLHPTLLSHLSESVISAATSARTFLTITNNVQRGCILVSSRF